MVINWLPSSLFRCMPSRRQRRATATLSRLEHFEDRTLLSAAPIVTLPVGSLNYTENATALLAGSGATVTDSDSVNFNGGNLTATITANADVNDQLEIKNVGTAAGQIGVSGTNVTYGGTTIGTFTGGTAGTALTVSLNANATPAAVQVLINNITYRTAGDNPSTLARTLEFVVDDGTAGGISTPVDKTITVTAVNDIPVVNVSGVAIPYTAGASAIVAASAGTVTDVDSANFNGGSLTVDATAGASVNNTIAIKNQGTAAGQIGVSGSNVTFGGTTIGTSTGGVGTTPLVITFNPNATPAAIQALVRQITFSTNASATAGTTTLRFVVDDGDGGVSLASTIDVNVSVSTEVNLPPVVVTTEGSTRMKGGYQVVDPGLTVTDADSANFDGGHATITTSGNHDRLRLNHRRRNSSAVTIQGRDTVTFNGTVVGSVAQGRRGGQTLAINFNANATPAIVQSVLRAVTIHANRSSDSHVVSFQVTDGDGGTSNIATKTVVRTRGPHSSAHHRA